MTTATTTPSALALLTAEVRHLHPRVHTGDAAAALLIRRYEKLVEGAALAKGATPAQWDVAYTDAYMDRSDCGELFADGDPFEDCADAGASWSARVVEAAFRRLFPR